MELIRNVLKRCLPIVLALVVVLSSIPLSYAASYSVSYEWLFNDSVSLAGYGTISVSFSCNGVNYTSMTITSSAISYANSDSSVDVYLSGTGWVDAAYQTVDFGSSRQSVNSSFYYWFDSAATCISPSIAGVWKFDPVLSGEDFYVMCYFIEASVPNQDFDDTTTSSYSWKGISYDSSAGELTYLGNGRSDLVVYSASSGWLADSYKSILLYSEAFVSSEDYAAFSSNAYMYDCINCGLVYTTTIEFPDTSFIFSHQYGACGVVPEITISTSDDGVLMTDGFRTKLYPWPDNISSPDIYVDGALMQLDGSATFSGSVEENVKYSVSFDLEDDGDDSGSTDPTYSTYIYFDDDRFVFTGSNASPDVTITVNAEGAVMTDGVTTQTYMHMNDFTFLGIALKEDYPNIFCAVGTSHTVSGLSGADRECYFAPVFDTESTGDQGFCTRVLISYEAYCFYGETGAPNVTLTVTATGCTLTDGVTSQEYVYSGDHTFLGLRYYSDAEDVARWSDGDSFVLEGIEGGGVEYSYFLALGSSEDDSEDPEGEYVLQAGLYQAKYAVMTGEFMELPDWPESLGTVSLFFYLDGMPYSSIFVGIDATGQDMLWYKSSPPNNNLYAVYGFPYLDKDVGWTDPFYTQITLEDDQEVDPAFYEWFNSAFTLVDEFADFQTTTTINIWDAAGLNILHTITFTDDLSPVVQLTVADNGCTLTYDGQSSVWSYSGTFYGFRISPKYVGVSYKVGKLYTLPGGGQRNVTVDLYVADSQESFSDLPSTDLIASLLGPVEVFFTIEFFPGFSFGRICLICFLVGLVFWFLKVVK